MQDLEQAIREHAYHLWVSNGCLDGNAEAYWLTAQREVLAASLSDVARVEVSTKAKKKGKATAAAKPRRQAAA